MSWNGACGRRTTRLRQAEARTFDLRPGRTPGLARSRLVRWSHTIHTESHGRSADSRSRQRRRAFRHSQTCNPRCVTLALRIEESNSFSTASESGRIASFPTMSSIAFVIVHPLQESSCSAQPAIAKSTIIGNLLTDRGITANDKAHRPVPGTGAGSESGVRSLRRTRAKLRWAAVRWSEWFGADPQHGSLLTSQE